MSDFKNTINDIPKKPWNDSSSDEIRRFHLKNVKKYDCSFKSEDPENKKIYKSFKWILCEMSPVLKEILNDEENQAKNCKEIVVSNPKHIEAVLFYGHFKVVDTEIINLVDFYEASKEYQVKALEDEVIIIFKYSLENQKKANWVKLYWLSYVKYPEDQQMQEIFEKVVGHVDYNDKVAEASMDFILEFDQVIFDIFFNIMVSRSLDSCYKITKAYLIKNIFDGNANKKLEDIDPSERNLVEWYINKINLGDLNYEIYKNGPLVSRLLTKERKIEHLEIHKRKLNPQNSDQKNTIYDINLRIKYLKTKNMHDHILITELDPNAG